MDYKKLHVPIRPTHSAVIPYRVNDGAINILLITSRSKGKWIIPKGNIEPDLDSHTSAEQEAYEEAGVKGEVSDVSLGCYRHGSTDEAPVVEVFLMRVERELPAWPEQDERTRRWVSLEEAYEHVDEDGLKSVLDDAAALMRLALAAPPADRKNGSHPAFPEQPGDNA